MLEEMKQPQEILQGLKMQAEYMHAWYLASLSGSKGDHLRKMAGNY